MMSDTQPPLYVTCELNFISNDVPIRTRGGTVLNACPQTQDPVSVMAAGLVKLKSAYNQSDPILSYPKANFIGSTLGK
jgi:hypothetical protein